MERTLTKKCIARALKNPGRYRDAGPNGVPGLILVVVSKRNASWTFGDMPVATIDVPTVLRVLEQKVPAQRGLAGGRFWDVRPTTASRVRARVEQVLGCTIRGHRTGDNPARWKGHLDQVLPTRGKTTLRPDGRVEKVVKHHAALPYGEVPKFLAELRTRPDVAAQELAFLTLTVARTGEALGAKGSEIEFESRMWTIPAERMKARRPHRVPLAPAVIEILRNCFTEPGMSTFLSARAVVGFRTCLWWRQCGEWAAPERYTAFAAVSAIGVRRRRTTRAKIAERALAHTVGSATERAYERSDLLEKRRRLMERWATFCSTQPAEMDATVASRDQSMTDHRPLARQRIKLAKAILGSKCNEASVAGAVWTVLVEQERGIRRRTTAADAQNRPTNKKEKAPVDRVSKALRRLAATLRDSALPKFVRGYFPDELLERLPKLEALAKLPLGKPRRPGSSLQRRAVLLAADLLEEHKLPLKKSRNGKLHQLAAALYGKPDADLFDFCRLYVVPAAETS